jgi:ubiquinone/menaquinone biosynthesis C-methylase UbiE
VDEAERALLDRLLLTVPSARSALEVGCGTGHFTRWLAQRLPRVIGIDRSPAMLAQAARLDPRVPVVVGDAHTLPFGDRSLDLVVLVTALEFLNAPDQALAEAVRVARQAIIPVVLNRWSLGGLSRRWGAQSRKPILSQAHDYSLSGLRAAVRRAAGPRLSGLTWRSAVFPRGMGWAAAAIPAGDVLGIAAALSSSSTASSMSLSCYAT